VIQQAAQKNKQRVSQGFTESMESSTSGEVYVLEN
jgi:hypothetical protein